jgi:hypothetical protein
MKVDKMKIDEMQVHRAIISKQGQHELIEAKLGIKIAENSLHHHYQLSKKGEHIDFVFKDIAGNTYIAEVKINTSPLDVIPQLYKHEYKKFIEINPKLDRQKIFPLIIIDEENRGLPELYRS